MAGSAKRMSGAWAIYLILLGSGLASCGCLVIAAGATAGGAALGYAYYKGEFFTSYHAGLDQSRAAVRAGLADLRMPILREEVSRNGGFLESRTSQGARVKIYLTTEANKTPAEGPVTRIGVRAGVFGDQEASEQLLNQITTHLSTVVVVPAISPEGPIRPVAAIGPAPQSPPPPLAK